MAVALRKRPASRIVGKGPAAEITQKRRKGEQDQEDEEEESEAEAEEEEEEAEEEEPEAAEQSQVEEAKEEEEEEAAKRAVHKQSIKKRPSASLVHPSLGPLYLTKGSQQSYIQVREDTGKKTLLVAVTSSQATLGISPSDMIDKLAQVVVEHSLGKPEALKYRDTWLKTGKPPY